LWSPDSKLSYWGTPAGQDGVDLVGENIGIVILVSKNDTTPMLATGAGALTAMCTQDPGLVTCVAGDGNQSGLSFIHGWSPQPAGTGAAPRIRDVRLFNVTCADDLSAPYFLRAGDCDLGALAVVDFGVAGDPSRAAPDGVSAQLLLNAPGCGGGGCTMRYVGVDAFGGPTDTIWQTTRTANLDRQSGRTTFSIQWSTQTADGNSHSGTFGGVAHPYVANDASGPVEYLDVSSWDTGVPDGNSRSSGPDRSVVVTVGFRKPLRIEDPLASPALLRVASPSGSQNQAFDCDRGVNFATEIENGCQTTYALNYDDWSTPKDGLDEWADLPCAGYGVGDLPPDSSYAGPAPICVAVETGDKIGQFRQGLSQRFETPTCWPNNWPEDQPPVGRGPEDDEAIRDFFRNHDFANDPRYVTLIVTDVTAFQGQGSDQVPIKFFAGFYATGWDVVGNVKPCLDNDPHPWYGSSYRKSLDNGDVWGHFINIVVFSSSGRGSDELCNWDELGNCIAVLVE
jgi:hypothetical protein